jgi:hypothetical protein
LYSASDRLFAAFSFKAARNSSARENCAEAACRFTFVSAVPDPSPAKQGSAPKKRSASENKITGFPRAAKTGETRANLLWKIIRLSPMPNLMPLP